MTLMSFYATNVSFRSQENCGKRYDFIVSAQDSGSIDPGLSPDRVKAIYSDCANFADQCILGKGRHLPGHRE